MLVTPNVGEIVNQKVPPPSGGGKWLRPCRFKGVTAGYVALQIMRATKPTTRRPSSGGRAAANYGELACQRVHR